MEKYSLLTKLTKCTLNIAFKFTFSVFLFFFVFWLYFRPPIHCLMPFSERQFFTPNGFLYIIPWILSNRFWAAAFFLHQLIYCSSDTWNLASVNSIATKSSRVFLLKERLRFTFTPICTTWPSFPLNCRVLFFTSTQK